MTTTTVQLFDPAMCCSTGVCGQEVDQELVRVAADVAWARGQGAVIERLNLAQQPLQFAENAVVKDLLDRAGRDALPVTLVNGQVALAGRYPSREQLARWGGVAKEDPAVAGSCCSGGRCC